MHQFWMANAGFFQYYATFIRSMHGAGENYVGAHITIGMDDLVEKIVYINDQSLDILLQTVKGKPEMRSMNYPSVFTFVLRYKTHVMCYEVDLVQEYVVSLLGKGAEVMLHNAINFIVSPHDITMNETNLYPQVSTKSKLMGQKWDLNPKGVSYRNFLDWKHQCLSGQRIALN